MLWKVGFPQVSSHIGHQSSRLRSWIKPHEWGHVHVFFTLTQTDFFYVNQANFEANSAKLCDQLPIKKTQAEYSTNSTEVIQI